MRYHALALAALASAAVAQDRCDASEPSIDCSAVPEIMAYRSTDCRPTHIFITRGTDEVKPGRLGNITRLVCDALGGAQNCGWEDVDYPAANRYISNSSWCESAATGVKNGQAQLKKYVERCPASKVVLFGFSQGATVTQDLLGGGGGPLFGLCTQEANGGLDRAQAPGASGKTNRLLHVSGEVLTRCSRGRSHVWHRSPLPERTLLRGSGQGFPA
jgi:acetylxylan esterase